MNKRGLAIDPVSQRYYLTDWIKLSSNGIKGRQLNSPPVSHPLMKLQMRQRRRDAMTGWVHFTLVTATTDGENYLIVLRTNAS